MQHKEQYARELAWLNPKVITAENRALEIEGLVDQMNLRLSLLGSSHRKTLKEVEVLKVRGLELAKYTAPFGGWAFRCVFDEGVFARRQTLPVNRKVIGARQDGVANPVHYSTKLIFPESGWSSRLHRSHRSVTETETLFLSQILSRSTFPLFGSHLHPYGGRTLGAVVDGASGRSGRTVGRLTGRSFQVPHRYEAAAGVVDALILAIAST